MSYGIERRITNLARQATSEREVVAQNRRIVASMVEDYVRTSSQPPDEARRLFTGWLGPELAAHLADDWETNPLTLEALRIINQTDGHSLLYERTLERLANSIGLEPDEALQLWLLDSRFTFEQQMHMLRIAHRRGILFVMVNLHGPDLIAKAEAAAQRHAEIDEQERERLAAKGYGAAEIEQIITQATELRERIWDTVEPERLVDEKVCDVCGAENTFKAKMARKVSEFLRAEGYSAEQVEKTLAQLAA
jgi:ribosomal protein L40E